MNSFHKTKQKSHVESGRKEGLLKLFSKLSTMPSLVFSVYPKSSSISLKNFVDDFFSRRNGLLMSLLICHLWFTERLQSLGFKTNSGYTSAPKKTCKPH